MVVREGPDLRGMHGYPATVEDMAAFLVAIGPGFSVGKVIPKAHQLDVYPVAATLLELAPSRWYCESGWRSA